MKTLQCNFQDKSSTTDKGSDWVHSLNWDVNSQDVHLECNDQVGKRKLKNILP